jgi:hypothetical protein
VRTGYVVNDQWNHWFMKDGNTGAVSEYFADH